jgi:two-component system, NarL family, sensor histidine kinase UhpB
MRLTDTPLNFLVVEDNEGDFLLFEAYLHQTNVKFEGLYHSKSLSEISITEEDIDIAFLDLSLPDSGGVESFINLNQRFPHIPIVVLSGLADEKIARRCIAMGAQDYLLKNELNERFLEKSVYYSIERKKNMEDILAVNQQYELIGSVTNDVIWNWNLETDEIFCPKKSFLGYRSDEIENGIDWWMRRIHPEDVGQMREAIQNVQEKKATHFQVEYRFRSGEGVYQYLFSRGAIIPAKRGEPKLMIGALMNITERKKLEEELLKSQLNFQRQLTEAMILGQEKQKEEIGRELHDNINQVLASVKLYIDTAIGNVQMKDDMLRMSKENVVYAINEIRKLSHSLVPPSLGDHGLLDALKELVDELNNVGLFEVLLEADNFEERMIDNSTKLMLFRIVQEQVNNIMKYAKAANVWLSFEMSAEGLMLSIKDDGIGFDTSIKAKGIGLKNIESRVAYYSGKVQLESNPGKGTTLQVLIPLK